MNQYCDILEHTEDGFVDFSFDIMKVKKKFFGGLYLECSASYRGTDVGFGLEIRTDMQGIVNNDPQTFCTYKDGLRLSFLNGFSKNLIPVMLHLYGFEPVHLQMKKSVLIECGALSENPIHFDEEVQFKCFVEPSCEEKYAEFYMNIDLKRKKVHMREKDVTYRGNIILYLSE